MKKLNYITALRAFAILLVLVVHARSQSTGIDHLHPLLISLLDNGARGVQLFYVLSAFTLFMSFVRHSAKDRKPVLFYFIRRFFRIAPLFYLAIVYYLWQDGLGPRYWLGNAPVISRLNIISNFTFTQGFSPYWITSLVPGGWSVAVEVAFYCLMPIFFKYIKNLNQAIFFTFITLFIRSSLLLLFQHYVLISDTRLWNEYLFLYFPNQLPVFSLGIIVYYLSNSDTTISRRYFLFVAIVLFIGLSVGQDLIAPAIFGFGVAFVLLILFLQNIQGSWIYNKAFLFIGYISYTIYLTHWAAIYFLNKHHLFNPLTATTEPHVMVNFAINYLMILAVSVAISTALHFSVEIPMQEFGKTIITKLNRVRKYQ